MASRRYGVLKGMAVERRLGAGPSPHDQVHLVDEQRDYRIAMPDGLVRIVAALVNDTRSPERETNQGGLLTLLNDQGLKVHGVSYSREQARRPGWSLVF